MISAIVLAAGESTRYGRTKQLELLEPVLQNLRKSKVGETVVVLGAHADDVRKQIRFERERVVFNPDFANGMSTSLQAGLREIKGDAALIVLADQPFVRPETFDRIIAEYERSLPQVVIPTFDGRRGNPVLVDRSLFAEMMNIRGDIGCRAIFGEHANSIVKIAVEDRGVVTDIDTPMDLATGDVLDAAVELRRRRLPFAIATVVRAERPTSSKPGDKAIIAADGTLTGWIGGSCAHDIVVRNALEAIDQGAPRFLTLSATAAAEAKRFGVIEVPMQCYSGGVLDVFIEPSLPRPHMVIVGNETIAQALARISQILRFQVTAVDDGHVAALNLSGETYVVVATHGRYDEEALEQAVKIGATYIALVASPKRAGVILDALRERGVDTSGIKSPAGLDLGAEGAEEIALSIAAEIVQQRRAAAKRGVEVSRPETAIDPICNMTVDVADARYTSEFQGQRYYFCCAHCQRTFEQSHVA